MNDICDDKYAFSLLYLLMLMVLVAVVEKAVEMKCTKHEHGIICTDDIIIVINALKKNINKYDKKCNVLCLHWLGNMLNKVHTIVWALLVRFISTALSTIAALSDAQCTNQCISDIHQIQIETCPKFDLHPACLYAP